MTTKWRRLVMVGLLLALALLVVRAQPTPARAALPQARNAPGELDISFGGDGLVTTDFAGAGDSAQSVAHQPDGKIVVAGRAQSRNSSGANIALARYNADGSLDTSFGDGDGLVTTNFAGIGAASASMVLQPDGKIVVAGITSSNGSTDFALARYNANGSLDTSFGDGDGLVNTDFAGGSDEAQSVALQPDGKIVVAGHTRSSDNYFTDFALARYNANGSLDTSFGDGDGLVTTEVAEHPIMAHSVALQPDDKIVVAGYIVVAVPDESGTDGEDNDDFALARYNANGSLDTSFGDGDGLVTTDFVGANDRARSMALQPDGKLVVAGSAVFPGGNVNSALARYNPNGSLDTSFGGDGLVNSGIVYDDAARSVVLQPNGKIVAAGYMVVGYSGPYFFDARADFALARYNADGSPDTSFGGDGLVNTSFREDKVDSAYSVALQSDGKILVAGYAEFPGSSFDFALARYEGDLYLYLPLIAR